MIASSCCGSCENCDNAESSSYCSTRKIYVSPDYETNTDCYSPRNPVKSQHEKMWDELIKDVDKSFKDFKDNPEFRLETNALLLVLDKARHIKEKYDAPSN